MTDSTGAVPLSRWRAGLVNMVTASHAIPQFWVEREVDVTRLAAWRSQRVAPPALTDLLIAAAGRGLVEVPVVNARFGGDAIVLNRHVNVGLLMPIEDGLVAPAIKDVPGLGLGQISSERRRLAEVVAAGRLRADDLTAGTFTISNLGPYGVTRFQAMVLPPRSAVLAVGSLQPGDRLSLIVTVDHRAVDGVAAAELLAVIADALQTPAELADPVATR